MFCVREKQLVAWYMMFSTVTLNKVESIEGKKMVGATLKLKFYTSEKN
jgi:hypothetical protein